jgi:TPR repeat protein
MENKVYQLCPYCHQENSISFKNSVISCSKCRNIFEVVKHSKVITDFTNIEAQAELGNPEAQLKVSDEYSYKDEYEKSRFWAQKALDNGNLDAHFKLGRLYYFWLGKTKENFLKAIEHFSHPSLAKDNMANLYLGSIFMLHKIIKRNYKRAYKHIKIAAESGEGSALYHLGVFYHRGKVVKKDYKRAFDLFKQAGDKGSIMGYHMLGLSYLTGQGVEKDYKKAKYYFEQSAKNDVGNSMTQLGLIYAKGKGVNKDLTKAANYFKNAHQSGYTRLGSYNYAKSMIEGLGISKNKKEAMAILKNLVKEKHTLSIKYLNKIKEGHLK